MPRDRLCLAAALLAAAACGNRSPPPTANTDARAPAHDAHPTVPRHAPEAKNPGEGSDLADGLRALRAEAARRCHSGSAQLSMAGDTGSRCTVERGCTETRGKVSPSDGRLTLECRGLACTCTFGPRGDKANRKRIQFAIDRPCGLSRGARAESLWLEQCFPLLPLAAGGAATD